MPYSMRRTIPNYHAKSGWKNENIRKALLPTASQLHILCYSSHCMLDSKFYIKKLYCTCGLMNIIVKNLPYAYDE